MTLVKYWQEKQEKNDFQHWLYIQQKYPSRIKDK